MKYYHGFINVSFKENLVCKGVSSSELKRNFYFLFDLKLPAFGQYHKQV